MFKLGVLVFAIFFATLEIALRIKSQQTFFTKVLSQDLVFYEPFSINENFIFSHHSGVKDSLNSLRNIKNVTLSQLYNKIVNANIDLTSKYISINYLAQLEDLKLDSNVVGQSTYQFLYEGIQQDIRNGGFEAYKSGLLSEFSKPEEKELNEAVLKYLVEPINSDGLRSIEMKNYTTDRKKVLLLGDSYPYGYTAIPIYNSFADQLLAQGYVVYNTGVPGTNCLNYLYNAKHFIELLQPDYVFTFVYLDNDIVEIDLANESGFIPYHASSSGWHSSIIGTEYYPDKQEWLKELKLANNIPQKGKIFHHSAVFIWVENKWDTLKYRMKLNRKAIHSRQELTNSYLKEIEWICKKANSASNIVIIPECKSESIKVLQEKYKELFEGLNLQFPPNFVDSDFRCEDNDQHFNNYGHRKMADYIVGIINEGVIAVE
jgi:hypothetical protein